MPDGCCVAVEHLVGEVAERDELGAFGEVDVVHERRGEHGGVDHRLVPRHLQSASGTVDVSEGEEGPLLLGQRNDHLGARVDVGIEWLRWEGEHRDWPLQFLAGLVAVLVLETLEAQPGDCAERFELVDLVGH